MKWICPGGWPTLGIIRILWNLLSLSTLHLSYVPFSDSYMPRSSGLEMPHASLGGVCFSNISQGCIISKPRLSCIYLCGEMCAGTAGNQRYLIMVLLLSWEQRRCWAYSKAWDWFSDHNIVFISTGNNIFFFFFFFFFFKMNFLSVLYVYVRWWRYSQHKSMLL